MLYIDDKHRVRDGADRLVPQDPSPNHGGVITPEYIVMHYTAGWTAESAINTLTAKGSGVSAQVVVDTDGTITQLLPMNVKGWHAGPSIYNGVNGLNNHSIGIEIVNPGYLRKVGPTTYQNYTGSIVSANAQGGVKDFPGLVAAEHPRVGSGTFYWPVYTEAQITAVMALTKALIAKYPILDIVSHEEIDKRGWKTDPGPAFPMATFKKMLVGRDDSPDRAYEVTASSLNARGGPGTNFEVLGKFAQGDEVIERQRYGDWVRVNDDLWVHGGYLRRVR